MYASHKQVEVEKESQSVQSLNFDKVLKNDNQCEMPHPPLTFAQKND